MGARQRGLQSRVSGPLQFLRRQVHRSTDAGDRQVRLPLRMTRPAADVPCPWPERGSGQGGVTGTETNLHFFWESQFPIKPNSFSPVLTYSNLLR